MREIRYHIQADKQYNDLNPQNRRREQSQNFYFLTFLYNYHRLIAKNVVDSSLKRDYQVRVDTKCEIKNVQKKLFNFSRLKK
jgi:hypothetical protein